MKLIMTEPQLLKEWQLRSFPQSAASGYSMQRNDGIDIAAFMKARMNDWYRQLLHTAPARMLNPLEIGDICDIETSDDGTGIITLPEGVVRVTDVILSGWRGNVTLTDDPQSRTARMQASRYTRGSAGMPVAVALPEHILVCPATGGIVSVKAVIDTPGRYALDSSAFATITPLQP